MAGSAGGAFNGLYQGASGASDAAAALKPLLPNISVYQQGPSSAPALQNQITTPSQNTGGGGGALSNFEHFLGGIGSEVGHMAGGAATWLGHNALNMVEAPVKLAEGLGHGIVDRLTLNDIYKQNAQSSARLSALAQQYKAGRITGKQYRIGLASLNQDFQNLDRASAGMVNKVTLDQKSSTEALINTASGLITILTAGFGAAPTTAIKVGTEGVALEPTAAKTAVDWLASKAAAPILEPASATISRLASDSRLFQPLDAVTKNVLQRATAEVVSQAGPTMTAGQIARATAANVALKYPIYFNYMSTTANQVYQELDQHKYGDAIRTLAFNAALVLSGGPIGQAIKYGGDVVKGITARTFGKTAFWDELGKLHGDPSAYINEIATQANAITDTAARQDFIKNLAAAEATNVNAMGGDAVAGAARVAKGMASAYGIDIAKTDPAYQIKQMVTMAQDMRLAQDTADKLGLGPVAIGRWDVRSKGPLADAIAQTEDKATQFKALQDYIDSHPNDPLAYNDNLQTQLHNVISNSGSAAELRQGIMDIKALPSIEGFPQKVLDQLASNGHIPIQPKNLQAPFREGGDKLLTAHANGEDFFMKSVQPLPVLGSVGNLFTNLGLSPVAAQQRAYEYLNDYFAKNLEEVGAITRLQGEDIRQTSDALIKQLSNYAHDKLKIPVQDLRMLTNKQIRDALQVSSKEATDIQHAIAQAHIQVPLAVRGMGDRAVDWTYGLPVSSSIARRYLKIQGALRFSFNPFFQYLRLIPKTEILSEAEGGGALRSVFMGRAGQISDIRQGLRAEGLLDTVGRFGTVQTGEAAGATGVEEVGVIGKNLVKHLAPGQEISIAGLIDSQAQRMGMDWRDFIHQFPHETADTIQRIAEYDRHNSFLNSPFARTLNIAFFPFRFDVKVATIMGQSLARTSLLTQVSFINGLMKAHSWLNSPEGHAWYAKNSEAIGLFNYITPFARMNEVVQSLLPGHDHSLGNFGELGGLPFGWIPLMLDSEGLTHFNQTGVSAKTGQAYPDYTPATTKGQAAIALQDLISGLFSYPGATIGAISKTKISSTLAKGLTGAKATDFNKTIPPLSADQQHYQQDIEQAQPQPPKQSYQSAPSGTATTNPTGQSAASEIQVKYKAPAGPKPKKLKKSDYPVQLPPGQTQAGVL